ncbi:hypothetical protein P7K49_040885, partial [Saguinus oedipus]
PSPRALDICTEVSFRQKVHSGHPVSVYGEEKGYRLVLPLANGNSLCMRLYELSSAVVLAGAGPMEFLKASDYKAQGNKCP